MSIEKIDQSGRMENPRGRRKKMSMAREGRVVMFGK
jgi:hypothetical protein